MSFGTCIVFMQNRERHRNLTRHQEPMSGRKTEKSSYHILVIPLTATVLCNPWGVVAVEYKNQNGRGVTQNFAYSLTFLINDARGRR